jgi:monothiol glutaredoxin
MKVPAITLSDGARRAIQEAAADAGENTLRITITDRFQYEFELGPRADGDVVVDYQGITLLLDPASALRADGLFIDFVESPDRSGFTIHNPNEPPKVRQVSAPELKAMIDSRLPLELIDVRTERERAIAKIEGSRLLDEDGREYVMGLDRDTPLVFQCHHGIRSQAAAEYCVREGFRNVYNLRGGIDAWSLFVDPSVPRY